MTADSVTSAPLDTATLTYHICRTLEHDTQLLLLKLAVALKLAEGHANDAPPDGEFNAR